MKISPGRHSDLERSFTVGEEPDCGVSSRRLRQGGGPIVELLSRENPSEWKAEELPVDFLSCKGA